MSEETNVDDVLVQGTDASAGVPTPATDTGQATPLPDHDNTAVPVAPADTHPEVMDNLPSIKRKEDEVLRVDDNLNFNYVLKNGKTLKTSVKKPDLGISTQLSDSTIRFNETETGERYMMVNNVAVYQMVMSDLIKAILVDGAPMHSVTFEQLSKVGMTKSELDDYMNIITTFYLSE